MGLCSQQASWLKFLHKFKIKSFSTTFPFEFILNSLNQLPVLMVHVSVGINNKSFNQSHIRIFSEFIQLIIPDYKQAFSSFTECLPISHYHHASKSIHFDIQTFFRLNFKKDGVRKLYGVAF